MHEQALAHCGLFLTELAARLQYPKAIIQRQLLQIASAVFKAHPSPAALLQQAPLYQTVVGLTQAAGVVLVSTHAQKLLLDMDEELFAV